MTILKMKQTTTKVRRYLVNKLGGELKEDYVSTHYHRVTHDIIKYDRLAYIIRIDSLRPRLPQEVYEYRILREIASKLRPYVTFTEDKGLHIPHTSEIRAELWVGKHE